MARSLAQVGYRAPRPAVTQSLAQSSEQLEREEPPLEAEPKLGRDVVLYMEPRPAIDGAGSFGQCANCANFIPEISMRGAIRGDRCALFGSNFPIGGNDSCGLFVAWPAGKACDECIDHAAEDMIAGLRGSVSPYEVGYVANTSVRCGNCRFFDWAESECEMLEGLNTSLPDVFACDTSVKASGCCNLFCAISNGGHDG